ncbi:hypothetical protein [Allorhizocola rhizosphaerae]|uniref:hypothetical protein n=1 Tax=Allorhizocola rhizosphaerae TaxID=1872709 RepID=UPI000E3EDB54|nr:hypothetical protein [Allorhizocola rhizosphaerae]
MNHPSEPGSFAELACTTVSVFCVGYGLLARGWLRAGLLVAAIALALVAVCVVIARRRRSRDG